jgi:hypothetical protein
MTIVAIPQANPPLTAIEGRKDCGSPTTTPVSMLRRRLTAHIRNAIQDHQPVLTLSERVLSDIDHVHSLHR